MTPNSLSRLRVVVAVLLLLTTAGCSGDQRTTSRSAPDRAGPPTSSAPGDVLQLQPGGPGDPVTPRDPDEPLPSSVWNDADAAFLAMMVPHHQQAIEMSALAVSRALDPQVRAAAERIAATQGPEITLIETLLEQHGAAAPDGHHDGDLMAGMLSADQMAALAGAEGEGFDRLFLEGMIQHHQGAVAMALDVLRSGSDLRVNELANDVNAGQGAEIRRMRDVLDGLDRR